MKSRYLLLLMCLSFMAAKAQTIQVSGDQTGVWDADTVLVTGDVTVMDSLVVMPGVTVLFDGYYSIAVKKGARFEARGNEQDSVVFTVADTTGYSHYYSARGAWKGFQLEKSGRVVLEYCLLEYGKSIDSLNPFGGALNVSHCDDVHLHHSTFCHNAAFKRGGAVNAMESKVEMQDCSLHHNIVLDTVDYFNYGGAASFCKCDVEMRAMEFRNNDGSLCIGGALSFDSCSVVLDRAVFADNQGVNGGGLYIMRSNDYECKFSNLLFDHNFSSHFGGGFAIKDASPEISNVLVIHNESWGVSCFGIFFHEHSSPVLRNCMVYGNYPSPDNPQSESFDQMWVWTSDGYAPEFHHCLVEGGTEYIHSPEIIMVFEDIMDVDPLFVDAENHDFRLSEGSPCIDAGDPNTPQYVLDGLDLNGQSRVKNGRIDLGPFEYSGTGVVESDAAALAKLVGNPLDARSRIEFGKAVKGETTLLVYSLTGRCVAQTTLDLGGVYSLPIGSWVKDLAPGVYLIEVAGKDGVCTFKAVR